MEKKTAAAGLVKILVAESSITVQKVIRIVLTASPVGIGFCGTGTEALQMARLKKPDLILANYELEGLSGYDFCSAIKSDPATAGIVFILMGGSFPGIDEAKAREAGANDFLVLPFEAETLIGALEENLQRKMTAR